MDRIFKIIMDVVLVVLIILIGSYLLLRLLGIANIYKVKTGSMEDNIHAGDYILIVNKKNYKVGDIITYRKDNYYITHRIIKKDGNKIITKGDANNTEDEEITTKDIIGKVIYTGGFLNILIDFKFLIAGVLLGLYILSCYFDKKDQKKIEE